MLFLGICNTYNLLIVSINVFELIVKKTFSHNIGDICLNTKCLWIATGDKRVKITGRYISIDLPCYETLNSLRARDILCQAEKVLVPYETVLMHDNNNKYLRIDI